MVVGVPGEVVANLVDLEVRLDHAQILAQQMEDPNVLDLQVDIVSLKHVLEVRPKISIDFSDFVRIENFC